MALELLEAANLAKRAGTAAANAVSTAATTTADALWPATPEEAARRAGSQSFKAVKSLYHTTKSVFFGLWSFGSMLVAGAKTAYNFVKGQYDAHQAKNTRDPHNQKQLKESAEIHLAAAWANAGWGFDELKNTGYYAGATLGNGVITAAHTGATVYNATNSLGRIFFSEAGAALSGVGTEVALTAKDYVDNQKPASRAPKVTKAEDEIGSGLQLVSLPAAKNDNAAGTGLAELNAEAGEDDAEQGMELRSVSPRKAGA